jgi:TolA-binding protein
MTISTYQRTAAIQMELQGQSWTSKQLHTQIVYSLPLGLDPKNMETIQQESEADDLALLSEFVQGDVISHVRTTQQQIRQLQGQFVGEMIELLQQATDTLEQYKEKMEDIAHLHSMAQDTRNDHLQFIDYYEILFDTISLKFKSFDTHLDCCFKIVMIN